MGYSPPRSDGLSADMATILKAILDRKREEVAWRESQRSRLELEQLIGSIEPCRGFGKTLRKRVEQGLPAVIAEVKKASPSSGVIRENFDPVDIAKSYEQAGATCISVLTDRDFFQGSDHHLQQLKQAVSVPLIRKDFIISPYQVLESRVLGADCILLIVAAVAEALLRELNQLAKQLSMDVVMEVHTLAELRLAEQIGVDIIGVNNRNLNNFKVSLQTSIELQQHLKTGALLVSESGIANSSHIDLLRRQGIQAFLVGESLMRQEDPGEALKRLLGLKAG